MPEGCSPWDAAAPALPEEALRGRAICLRGGVHTFAYSSGKVSTSPTPKAASSALRMTATAPFAVGGHRSGLAPVAVRLRRQRLPDELNRPRHYHDGSAITYGYDGNGNQLTMDDNTRLSRSS